MNKKSIRLGAVSLAIDDYASQGSAVLGIRDSGKSYSSTYLAERLMDAGIPIVAFDPIGIWRFLRVAEKGDGYPVVVAGGEDGDLPLTPEGAPEIVRAALRDGVSLVIDLYSMHLSKADWKRIVRDCLRVMLYENKQHGLRHVFIEEAAEFCPQRVGPDQGQVYAEVEKLARMGGNALLGYTLINQRAEEVNKAVLELCDNLFLHRQKGKNSLNSLAKWLDVGDAKGAREIVASLPTLPQGECWLWASGSDTPVHVKMPAKRTFHPDRRAMRGAAVSIQKKGLNVDAFVEQMKGSLQKIVEDAKANDPKALKAQIADLTRQLAKADRATIQVAKADPAEIEKAREEGKAEGYHHGVIDGRAALASGLHPLAERAKAVAADIDALIASGRVPADRTFTPPARVAQRIEPRASNPKVASSNLAARSNPPAEGLNGPQQKIIDALGWWRVIDIDRPTRVQVAVVAGYSPRGGAFQNPLGSLRTMGLIDYPAPGAVALTDAGSALVSRIPGRPTEGELHAMVMDILDGPQKRILEPLLTAYPNDMSREELASASGYQPTGGAFQNPLGALRSLGLIDYPAKGRVVACPILFLEGK